MIPNRDGTLDSITKVVKRIVIPPLFIKGGITYYFSPHQESASRITIMDEQDWLGRKIDLRAKRLFEKIPAQPFNPSNAEAWAKWEAECDEVLGESQDYPGLMAREAYRIKGAKAARHLMDHLTRALDLPNNFDGDFWFIYGERIARTLRLMSLCEVEGIRPPGAYQPDELDKRKRTGDWFRLPESERALMLLSDFYPGGPRYIDPPLP